MKAATAGLFLFADEYPMVNASEAPAVYVDIAPTGGDISH